MFDATRFTLNHYYSIEVTDTKNPTKTRNVRGEFIGISHDILDIRNDGGQRYSVPLNLIQASVDVT